MGMFSGLFGDSSSSAQAAQDRQAALDAFSSIKTPALSDLQVQLNKYVQAGKLTPQQAETQLLGSSAFNAIVTDPSYTGAQKQALQQMQQIATQGGMTAIDKAQLNDITNQQNQQNRSQNAATMQQAQQRGMGGSDINTVNQLMNEQGNADRAATQGTQVAANAQTRALQAMQAAGQQGGALQQQAYGEAANKAQAQNAIDVFNKNTLNQSNLYNTQTANAAQGANLANAQAVANANTGTENANKEYNAQQVQQQYNDAMQKAQGIAGVNQNAATAAQNQKNMEIGSNAGMISGLVGTGATALGGAYGGPAGAAVANGMVANGGQTPPPYAPKQESDVTSPYYAEGGEVLPITWNEEEQSWELHDKDKQKVGSFPDYPSAAEYAEKVKSKEHMAQGGYCEGGMNMKQGGQVPGHAKVPGNSPKNDTVNAKLSPGEIVVPRTASKDDEEFDKFMEKFRPSTQKKMAKGGMILPSMPRVNETNPMKDTVHTSGTNPVPLAATNDYAQMVSKFKPPKAPKPSTSTHPELNALVDLHQRIRKLEEGGMV